MNSPSALFNDQFECNFSASGVQIVRVVIHLFLLRDENMSWIIWIIELRAHAGPHDGGMNTVRADYIKTVRLSSDTFALILLATVLDFLSFIHLLNFINLNPFWKAL